MIRINAAWLIQAKDAFDDLEKVAPGQSVMDNLGVLLAAQGYLQQIYSGTFYRDHVRSSRTSGTALNDQITAFLNTEDWNARILQPWEVAMLTNANTTFKTVFLADLGVMPIYIVAKKDTFDVTLLIERGIELFPPSIMAKVPEVEKDAAEVGRALAYELPTGCGFHTFRVTESVVRRYWDTVSNGKKRPKLETLGTFAAEMEKERFGDQKVVEAIKQMTRLHRNPLIHPEVILTVEEAIGTIGMARSVIAIMLQSLPDVPATTGALVTAAPFPLAIPTS